MGSDVFEPESTDSIEVKRLELALRMAEISEATDDPLSLAKYVNFFYLAMPRNEYLSADPEEVAETIDGLALAFGIADYVEVEEGDDEEGKAGNGEP